MKRTIALFALPLAALGAGVVVATAPHPSATVAEPTRSTSVQLAEIERPSAAELTHMRASRSRRIPERVVARATATPVPTRIHRTAQPVVIHHSRPAVRSSRGGCTDSNWLSTLGSDERWIDQRESGLDPTPSDVNPSSGARGLGQLLDSTYRDLGITPSWDPCDEIVAQRAYMRGRYGSWSNARAFWESHSWW